MPLGFSFGDSDMNENIDNSSLTKHQAENPVVDHFAENKRVIIKAMRENGIAQATVTYSGVGDSGGIDSIEASRSDDVVVNLSALMVNVLVRHSTWSGGGWNSKISEENTSLNEALEQFTYDWLEDNHSGWENNDGADGEVNFDIDEGKISITHRTHYTEVDVDEVEL